MTERYRLLRDMEPFEAGAIGVVVRTYSGDDNQYVVAFDGEPSLGLFTDPQLDPLSPEYVLEQVEEEEAPRAGRVVHSSPFEPATIIDDTRSDPDDE
jgi:hypothetical protein